MQDFWASEALDGLLGPILAPFDPIWSKNRPQNHTNTSSKLVPKMNQFFDKFWPHVGPLPGLSSALFGPFALETSPFALEMTPLVPPRWLPVALTPKRAPKAVST